MKKRKTIYHLIVDKSGSMSDCIDSTINGFIKTWPYATTRV